ncbi:serine hydrolase domain-containing protein [Aliikangiella marina]|nr:serine hydrolase [Aliikangiella marina]
MKKIILKSVAVFMAVVVGAGLLYHNELYRLYKVVYLFEESNIVDNFQNMTEFFPYSTIDKGNAKHQFEISPKPLIKSVKFQGEDFDIETLLQSTNTTGFIVIKDEKIIHEYYALGNTIDGLNISWSLNKSFVSALIGIALEEGLIASVEDPITLYVEQLKGSGYDGVSIKNILQMSSGVVFNEDYVDFNSDINRMGRVIALGSSINEFAATLQAGKPAGQYHHYVSMDTQVLGILLKQVTGKTPSEYLEEKIWSKLGMRSNARWLIDDMGMELVFGTLNATLRDYARFGQLYLNQGNWQGQQIIPENWVKDSITPDAAHLMPGDNEKSSSRFGYGYQWWLPPEHEGDFLGRGVYGQYIYVNPEKNVVIARTAANPHWRAGDKTSQVMVKMFQEIARSL